MLRRAALAFSALLVSSNAYADLPYVIDPGHGGTDPGASGCNLVEKEITLDLCTRISNILTANNVSHALTRTNDIFVELTARAEFANTRNATRFFSLHINSNAGTPATGSETYTYTSVSQSTKDYAQAIQNAMISAWHLRDRGVKSANYSVLRNTHMAASLAEVAFINNCEIDAPLMADSNSRQLIATEIANALMDVAHVSHSTTPVTPPSSTGTLTGVIFEDVGVGTDDMSRRLQGALVKNALGNSVYTNANGAFSFTVPEGTQTLTASLDGYHDNQRTCSAVANSTVWCSFGLTSLATDLPDAGESIGASDEEDAEIIEDATIVDATVQDAEIIIPSRPDASVIEPPQSDASVIIPPQPDAAVVIPPVHDASVPTYPQSDASRPGPQPVTPDNEEWETRSVASSGCSTTGFGNHFGALMLFAISALAMLLRRRGVLVAALLFVFGLNNNAFAKPYEALKLELLQAGHFEKSIISPNSQHALVTAEDSLFLLNLPQNELTLFAQGNGVARRPMFANDNEVLFHNPEQNALAWPALAKSIDGKDFLPQSPRFPTIHLRGDNIYVRRSMNADLELLGDEQTRYVTGILSPNRQFVVLWSLSGELTLVNLETQKEISLGRGENPAFAPNSQTLVFEQTESNGNEITGSRLFLIQLRDRFEPEPINVSAEMPRFPALSSDGSLFFTNQLGLWRAEIR